MRVKLFRFDAEDLPIPPAVRMTQRSKYTDARAQAYLGWKHGLGQLLQARMRELGWEEPFDCAVEVELILATALRPPGDVDNILKAVLDAANRIVFTDDQLVCRALVDLGPRFPGMTLDRWSLTVRERIRDLNPYAVDEELPF
jgi:Holliday junction resolvase RusA-like endonuclease